MDEGIGNVTAALKVARVCVCMGEWLCMCMPVYWRMYCIWVDMCMRMCMCIIVSMYEFIDFFHIRILYGVFSLAESDFAALPFARPKACWTTL